MATAAPKAEKEDGIRRLRELPPVRESQQRLLQVLNTDPDARDLAHAVEQCPEIAARILGLARSAYFAQRIECRSVHDAIVRILGFRLVRNLSTGLIMSGSFSSVRCLGFDSQRFWGDAVVTAALARKLARAMPVEQRPNTDDCYVGGLLHNIGVLVLAHLWPGEMSRVFAAAAAATPKRCLADVEHRILGIDHTRAGAHLAHRWRLSADVRTAIERHRMSTYRGPSWRCALLVGACSKLGRQLLLGEEVHTGSYPSLHLLEIAPDQFKAVVEQTIDTFDQLVGVLEVLA